MQVPIGSCVRSCQVLNRVPFDFDYFLLEPMTILSESLQDPVQVPICDQVRLVLLYRQIANSQANLLSKVRKRVKATKRNNKSQTSINKLFTKQKRK